MNAVEKWYEVMKSNNLDLLDDLLADDVTFYSPVVLENLGNSWCGFFHSPIAVGGGIIGNSWSDFFICQVL